MIFVRHPKKIMMLNSKLLVKLLVISGFMDGNLTLRMLNHHLKYTFKLKQKNKMVKIERFFFKGNNLKVAWNRISKQKISKLLILNYAKFQMIVPFHNLLLS